MPLRLTFEASANLFKEIGDIINNPNFAKEVDDTFSIDDKGFGSFTFSTSKNSYFHFMKSKMGNLNYVEEHASNVEYYDKRKDAMITGDVNRRFSYVGAIAYIMTNLLNQYELDKVLSTDPKFVKIMYSDKPTLLIKTMEHYFGRVEPKVTSKQENLLKVICDIFYYDKIKPTKLTILKGLGQKSFPYDLLVKLHDYGFIRIEEIKNIDGNKTILYIPTSKGEAFLKTRKNT